MSLSRFSKNRINLELQYSEDERPTAYQWINGKRIYRKVVDVDGLPNATSKTVNHGIISLDEIISIYGIAKSTTSFIPLPYPDGVPVEVFATDTQITIDAGATDRSSFKKAYVILEYTKD